MAVIDNNNLYVSCPACGDEESDAHSRLVLLKTLCISVLFTLPLLWDLKPVIQFIPASVVQFWPGLYFYKGAFRALKQKILGMDFLVALSTSIIYIYSTYITFFAAGSAKLYFLSECLLLSLILLGKYTETASRYEASASVRKLICLQPKTACVIRSGSEAELPLSDLLPADNAVIRAGDHIPIDGKITEGECLVDESMLTGEKQLIKKLPGDTLYCGTLCREGQVLLSCADISDTTMLQRMIDAVSNAQNEKAPIARLTDKIAMFFVPVVLLICSAVFCLWYFAADKGDLAQAVNCVCTTLVIACPCALGLATPAAIMAGSGRAAEKGILLRGGEQLEKACKIDTVIFDECSICDNAKNTISDTEDAVKKLKADGIDVWLISGAKEEAARHTASLLGIDNVIWETSSADMSDTVKKLRSRGLHVAVVGSGQSLSAALTCADMTISVGSTTYPAGSADVTVVGERMSAVPLVFKFSKATMKIIRQNLIWAAVYNVICIPVAAAGIINPPVAAIAMSLSSNGVLFNSLRLKNIEK